MSDKESLNSPPASTSKQKNHSATAVPLYRWRGAQPWLFDLETHQQGWLTCLHLTREGDTTLIPLAWDYHDTGSDDPRTAAYSHDSVAPLPQQDTKNNRKRAAYPTISLQTIALDNEAVMLTLIEMEQDGWHLNGRFDIIFTGADSEANFEQNIQQILWQTPQTSVANVTE